MENEEFEQPRLQDIPLEQIFKALGDPIRLSAVQQLIHSDGEEKACGTFQHGVTKATFSHHLQILREAGLTATRVDGTRKFLSLRTRELEKRFPGLLELIRDVHGRNGKE